MKPMLRFIFTSLLVLANAKSLRAENVPVTAARAYDIAAFVWPSYHPDDRAKIFWPLGIGEWQTVMNNQPKFEGQDQPRIPLWGYVNESDRYVMEMQIAAAADHGVNVFIYDWYWYDRMPFLEGCLNDGFLKAKNNRRMKFYLMWANHDVGLHWDKRNADDAFTQKNNALIWRGTVDRQEFEKIAHRWIEKYFSQPTYYKMDGRPVFMLYDLDNFIKGLGGFESAKDALAWFRGEVRRAGFPGLELQLSMRGVNGQKKLVEELGFDSLTHYQFCHFTDVNRDYNEIMKDVVPAWNTIATNFTARYYPQVSVGWDSSPRTFNNHSASIKNNTPANFERALRQARAFVDAHTNQAPLITINSWNEWTETSYLEPDSRRGYGYLDAVKNVFLEKDRKLDLALAANGASVTSDSEKANEPGCTRNVIDGIIATAENFTNRWHSALEAPHPHWVEVRLAKPAEISRAVIHFADPGGYPVSFEGSVRINGQERRVFNVTENDDPQIYEATIEPVTTDTFRLTIRASANPTYPNAAQISEIELFSE